MGRHVCHHPPSAGKFADLAVYIFFTGASIPKRASGKSALLGVHTGKAVYQLFNGVLGEKSMNSGNVQMSRVLWTLPEPKAKYTTGVIYGDGCRLGQNRLKCANETFKQGRYAVKVS